MKEPYRPLPRKCSFIHLFICSFVCLFVCLFVDSFVIIIIIIIHLLGLAPAGYLAADWVVA
jgi:hypothetical protein